MSIVFIPNVKQKLETTPLKIRRIIVVQIDYRRHVIFPTTFEIGRSRCLSAQKNLQAYLFPESSPLHEQTQQPTEHKKKLSIPIINEVDSSAANIASLFLK